MAQDPDKYIFVRSIRDIEAAHIRGNTTAVVWNSQTSTILNGDLKKVSTQILLFGFLLPNILSKSFA